MYTKIANHTMHLDILDSGAKNENPIGPPEFIKVTSNVNNYQFKIPYSSLSNAFLSGTDFYSGTTKVNYELGTQGCFTFT